MMTDTLPASPGKIVAKRAKKKGSRKAASPGAIERARAVAAGLEASFTDPAPAGAMAPAPLLAFGDQGRPAVLEGWELEPERVRVTFSYVLTHECYKGLKVRKTYVVAKRVPRVTLQLAVIPASGYRPFTYRANQVIAVGLAEAEAGGQPYAACAEYLVPGAKGVVCEGPSKRQSLYIREGATFGAAGPPLLSLVKRGGGGPSSFAGVWCALRNRVTGEKVKAVFDDRADELFFWRSGSIATLEWVYQPAYPDNDPHKVATWTAEYTLEYEPPGRQ